MSVINTGWLFPAVRQCEAEQEQVGEFLHWRQSQMCKNCTFIFVINIQLHSTDRHFSKFTPAQQSLHLPQVNTHQQQASSDKSCKAPMFVSDDGLLKNQAEGIFSSLTAGKDSIILNWTKTNKKPLRIDYSRVPTNSTYSAYYLIID